MSSCVTPWSPLWSSAVLRIATSWGSRCTRQRHQIPPRLVGQNRRSPATSHSGSAPRAQRQDGARAFARCAVDSSPMRRRWASTRVGLWFWLGLRDRLDRRGGMVPLTSPFFRCWLCARAARPPPLALTVRDHLRRWLRIGFRIRPGFRGPPPSSGPTPGFRCMTSGIAGRIRFDDRPPERSAPIVSSGSAKAGFTVNSSLGLPARAPTGWRQSPRASTCGSRRFDVRSRCRRRRRRSGQPSARSR